MIKRNMISVMHRRRWTLYATAVLAVVSVLIGVLFMAQDARADIVLPGSGSSGGSATCTGGNINGCPWTSNGHGWRMIPVGASNGPNGNGRWTNAAKVCSDNGSTHIIAYLIFTGEKTQETAWIYNYSPSRPDSWFGFNGSMSSTTARERYLTLSSDARAGYTFGTNVGLFCWNLNPPWSITANTTSNKAGIEVGEEVLWTHRITNSGPNRTNRDIVWQFQNKGADWPNTPGGNQTWTSGQSSGATTSITSRYTATTADFGKTLCRSTTAAPSSNTSALVTQSTDSCVVVGKKPKVQVHGGDLSVGKVFTGTSVTSQVNTSTTFRAGIPFRGIPGPDRLFGSWVEYGIFATGTVTGTASGSAFAATTTNPNACERSYLSFTLSTNTCSSATTVIGGYTPARLIPDVSVNFPQPGAALGASVTPNSLLSGAGTYIGTRTGNLTINASNLQPGKTVVLKVTGTATIVGNQVNNNDNNGAGYRGASQLPQLVVIANKIVIANSVSNVDAWLVANGADGTVETCDTGSSTYALSGAARLTGSKCNNSLTVNGPVMAKHLWLRRTANADGASPGTPAEVFNLRADAYLWAEAQSVSAGRIQTVYTTELPPRL